LFVLGMLVGGALVWWAMRPEKDEVENIAPVAIQTQEPVAPPLPREEPRPTRPVEPVQPPQLPSELQWPFPPIERTAELRELAIVFRDLKVSKNGREIVGKVQPTKQVLERVSKYHGRELQVTFYDKDAVKVTGGWVRYPDLNPGEIGEIA